MDNYLDGNALFGDDFTLEQIEEWYEDEAEAYAELGSKNQHTYNYQYHSWNKLHGYHHLGETEKFNSVLAFGSAYGHELQPVINRVDQITMVDPSDAFRTNELSGKSVRYIKPRPSGKLDISSDSFDLATCFGVLHHIPNVTDVIGEIARTLKPGATLLLREPIVSMGDWRKPRPGLTKRERGIPLKLLQSICHNSGLTTKKQTLCGFSLTPRIASILKIEAYNSSTMTMVDSFACRMTAFNTSYHSTTFLGRIRPTCVFLVLTKG